MTTWAEQAMHDPALRAFIEGEIVRAGIDVQTARVELAHAREVIADQQRKIDDLQAAQKRGKR